MFSLEKNVLLSPWNSPLDVNFITLFGEDIILRFLGDQIPQYNPYRVELDTLLDTFQNHLEGMGKEFTDNDINKAYKELYWFTQIQSNFVPYIMQYKQNLEKMKLLEEVLTNYKKVNIENQTKELLKQYNEQRIEKNKKLEKEYPNKKDLGTNEMKFISLRMNDIDKENDLLTAPLSGQRYQYMIQAQVKSDPYINEVRRKILIIEGAIEYLERLFKVCQEQVNTQKKIIENLMFLYNQSK